MILGEFLFFVALFVVMKLHLKQQWRGVGVGEQTPKEKLN